MKNITVAVEDEIYRRARVVAAERGTSLSALVRQHLTQLAGEQDRRRREATERDRLMEALLQKTAHFRIGTKPTREEMNER